MPAPPEYCPVYAPFFGILGCAAATIFSSFGAAYGTAKAGVGICAASVLRPDMIMRNSLPVILAGILAIYGLVISVVIANGIRVEYSLFTAMAHLGSGLAVGLAAMAAGFAIGIVGDAGVRGAAVQPRLFSGMVLILILGEVLGLYGLIVALLINARAAQGEICRGMLGLD